MITENLSTLKIHKLSQAQYERELEAGRIDENALYLTPDEEVDLSNYATKDDVENIEFPVYAAEESVDTSVEVINADTLQGFTADAFRKSDWVPSAADVGAVPVVVVGGDTLTWDGNTEGLVSTTDGSCVYVKVSNAITSMADFENGATISGVFDGEKQSFLIPYDAIVEQNGGIIVGGTFFISEDGKGENIDGLVFPESGVYFPVDSGITSITIPNYTGFSSKSIAPDYMPTAEEVGARPADWLPTIADIGAAPAGYGYGEPMKWLGFDEETWSSTDTFQSDLEAAFTSLPQGGCMQVQFINAAGLNSQKFTGTLWKYTDSYGFLTATNYSSVMAVKTLYDGVWQSWQWVNPANTLGTEYATTDRWDNKVVYRKTISVGKLPNTAEMSLTIENAAKIVSIDGYIAKGNYNIPIYAPNAAISSIYYNNSTKVLYITTSADRSDWNCYLDVKYTK